MIEERWQEIKALVDGFGYPPSGHLHPKLLMLVDCVGEIERQRAEVEAYKEALARAAARCADG